MRKIAKAITCLLLVPAFLLGCACDSSGGAAATTTSGKVNTPTTAATTAPTATQGTTEAKKSYSRNVYKMKDIADRLNILGRCSVTDQGLFADWSASGFEFVADCKNLIKITVSSSHDCRFNFYVDGGDAKTVNVSAGKRSYTLATDIDEGVHSFRFVKSSMVEYATKALAVEIESIELYGEIGKAEQRELFVEYIGDSITCGVGASSPSSAEAFSELSYAYLLSNKLDVDYSLVSVSGIGAGKSTERHGNTLIGDVYPLMNYYRSKTEKYSPERKADLVVINLNTNDKGSFKESQREEFLAKVKGLIDQVKATHGENVKIVWVMGMMTDVASGLCDVWTIQYLKSLGGESAGYYYVTVTKDRSGGSSHPIASAHVKVADELERFITDKGILGN